MPEPTTSTAAGLAAGGGLMLFGIVTGLHPALLITGAAGGWWALGYQTEPMPITRRISALVLAALSAAWGTPPSVAFLLSLGWLPVTVTAELIQYPVALVTGLLTHNVIGPGLMKLASKKIEGAA